MPPHGRCVRRQGDAAARLRGDRRARRPADRKARPTAAEPHAGHHDDREAASVPHGMASGLRRRGTTAGARRHAHRRRRLEPRPLGAGARPRALSRRQRVLDPALPRPRTGGEDQQAVEHGVPRVRRAAGDVPHRRHPGPGRTVARHRSGRAAGAQLLPAGTDHALRAGGEGRRAPSRDLGAASLRVRLRRTPSRGGAIQRRARRPQARTRDHAGEVRHLVHLHLVQPGRRARARLQGRLGAHQPRRHRDGTGPSHQDAAGGRHRPRCRIRARANRADPHRQGAQHVGDGRVVEFRPQRRRDQARVRRDPRPARGGGGAAARGRRARRAVLGRARDGAGPGGSAADVRGGRRRRVPAARAAVRRGVLPHRGTALGCRRPAGLPVQVLRVRRRGLRGRGRRLHRRVSPAPRGHRARRRRLALAAARHRPDRGRIRAGRRLADARGAAVGHRRRPDARTPAHPGGEHVQAPELLGTAGGVPRAPLRERPRGRRGVRLQGRRRAAAAAGLQRARGDTAGGRGVRAGRAERRARIAGDARGGVLGGGCCTLSRGRGCGSGGHDCGCGWRERRRGSRRRRGGGIRPRAAGDPGAAEPGLATADR